MGGGCGGPGAARARAGDGQLRGRAPGGRLRARWTARRGCGGISCAPIAGAGGVRCGRPGLVRLAAAGRAPRLRRAGGGGVTAGRVRFPVRRRAALVGGGIAAAPKFVVDMCVLEPMPAARAHAVRARAVHPRAGRVVHLCSVRPDRATSARQRRRHRGGAPARALCWRCACLRCRACVPHARVACTCCACACCACLRYARLRFPCSRCVHLLCLPLLCVPALCAFVRCVVCLCSAHLHRVELADPASPSTLATCHDLYPFPILSHICLLLSCIVPPSLPHFLLVLFLLFIPYFTAYFVLFLPAAVPPKGGTGLVVRS